MLDKNIYIKIMRKNTLLFVLFEKNVFLWHKYVFLSIE